ncbi:long-chain fatty acid--CoA ligase [Chloroflexota bacterium]
MLQDKPWFKFWPQGIPKHIDYPEIPLFGFLSNTARRYPDSTAFTRGDTKISYRELDVATSKLAVGLNEQGVKRGDRVALLLQNSLEYVIGYYGILKAGGTIIPINPLCKAQDLRHQLNDSSARAIIADTNSLGTFKGIEKETAVRTIISADSDWPEKALSLKDILAKYPPSTPALELNPKEDIAAIEYTGGTTGFPKGAMLTHYNLSANAIQNATWFGWNSDDIIIGLVPAYHSWGACTWVNSPIYVGAKVIILPRYDANELLMTIQQERATVLYGATSMFISLVNSPIINKYDLSSLRYVKAGAMPMPAEIKDEWEQTTGVKMVLGYGLSEASPETHNSPPQRVRAGTVGIPIMDTDARIVDEATGKVKLPPGKVGELVIRGPQVMKEYLNRPEDNREALRDDWLYTGDLAFMDEEGYFCIVDRKKEIIKYKGYTIAPAEVESTLYEHPAVKECAVVGKPDALAGELPKAYVVLKDGYKLCEEELVSFCESRVAPYKKIREVEFISEIPKTQVGKILRRVLRDRERGI